MENRKLVIHCLSKVNLMYILIEHVISWHKYIARYIYTHEFIFNKEQMSNIRNETCVQVSKINNNWHYLFSYVWLFEWNRRVVLNIKNNFFSIVQFLFQFHVCRGKNPNLITWALAHYKALALHTQVCSSSSAIHINSVCFKRTFTTGKVRHLKSKEMASDIYYGTSINLKT